MGQGHCRVMIYVYIVVLHSSMQHASFVEIGLPVPEKKIFEGVLQYMAMVAILVMTPGLFTNIFSQEEG